MYKFKIRKVHLLIIKNSLSLLIDIQILKQLGMSLFSNIYKYIFILINSIIVINIIAEVYLICDIIIKNFR